MELPSIIITYIINSGDTYPADRRTSKQLRPIFIAMSNIQILQTIGKPGSTGFLLLSIEE